ncbi:hypothetical protein HPB50_016114 [Hyalomma asiaticum]|uniref:Uncharacterized protein n=1 Tax=Hyalomma asiaticum TaxID=266040 RepID=A0ACB7T165_HYAAI|nr:hypothetical protein HPB50_016114 [Hyalomma asiaticum]
MDAKRRAAFDKEVASSLVRPPVALRPIAAAAAGSAALLDMYAMALQPCPPVDVPLGRHLRVYRQPKRGDVMTRIDSHQPAIITFVVGRNPPNRYVPLRFYARLLRPDRPIIYNACYIHDRS